MSPATSNVKTAESWPKVLEKAIRILDLFDLERPNWTAAEIAAELGMPASTTHRILRGLEEWNLVERENGDYRLGFGAIDLGRRAAASVDLRPKLRPILAELASSSQETVILTIYDEEKLGSLCIDRIEGGQELRLSIEIGRVTPITEGASAKALLAFLDAEKVEEILTRSAPDSEGDPVRWAKELRKDLEETRDKGLAVSYEENNVGAWGIAAPVLVGGRPAASIGIAAPTARNSEESVRELSAMVVDAAKRATEKLAAAGWERTT